MCRYASTCQTLGMNIGYFTSFTAFLALNDADFCNNYLRAVPYEEGILPLAGYLKFWGWFFVVITVLIAVFKHETNFQPAGALLCPSVQIGYFLSNCKMWLQISFNSMRPKFCRHSLSLRSCLSVVQCCVCVHSQSCCAHRIWFLGCTCKSVAQGSIAKP